MFGLGGSDTNIKAVITAEDKASSVLKDFGNQVDSMNTGINRGLKTAAVGLAVAGAAAVGFGVAAVKAFTESEDLIAQTNAVLKSTGGIAGVTAEEVDKLSAALERTTKFSDEEVRSAQNMLLTFTGISKKVFPDTTRAALDMATALKMDATSAAMALGKAMNSPTDGVTKLTRMGVVFTDKQKEQIKVMQEAGDVAGAQAVILKELQTEYGGSAEAAGGTFSGQLIRLKNQLNNAQEAIGGMIVQALLPLAAQLSDFVASDKFQAWLKEATTWLQINLPIAIAYVTQTLIPQLKAIFDELWPVIKVVIGVMKELMEYISNNTWVVWALVGAFTALKVAMMLQGALAAFNAVMVGVRVSYVATRALLLSPIILPALGIAAVLGSLAIVYAKGQETLNLLDRLAGENERALASKAAGEKQIFNLIRNGTPEQQKRARESARRLGLPGYATGGFTGVGAMNDIAGIVHKGEYVVPRSQVNQNTGTPNIKTNSSPISITVSVGVYTGSDIEMRKLTDKIVQTVREIASARGMSTAELLGA